MRKCLLLVALLLVSQFNSLKAQSLFDAPDTVCVRQPVYLKPNAMEVSTYFWGFCSGYLNRTPTLNNLGSGFNFNLPSSVEIAKDGNNYFGFVANVATKELYRLEYGTSLSNVPTVVNLGTLNNTLPDTCNSLYLLQDTAKNWVLFAAGGNSAADASIARFDFGRSLTNLPNSVNFGNLGKKFVQPTGLFVSKEGNNWYGFVVDRAQNALITLNFGNNISLTPVPASLGNVGSLAGPSDLSAIKDNNGNWHFLITNEGNNTLTQVDMGSSLTSAPVGNNIGNVGGRLFSPSAISVIKDCGSVYGFITNRMSNEITRIDMPDFSGTYNAKLMGTGSGAMNAPAALSSVVRDRDNLHAFALNGDNSMTDVLFESCSRSSIASSDSANPPAFKYDTAGIYTVYLAVDEGKPTMAVDCKQIVVLPIPKISISNDTTICQGDSINLYVQSYKSETYNWHKYYNMSDSVGIKVKVWPEFTYPYYVTLTYPDGCIVDTPITVSVSKVKADAGTDRTLTDGATTILGGPNTSKDSGYVYNWTPGLYLSNTMTPNPTATPAKDMTYYLEVIELNDNLGCKDIDTVVIKTACTELNLPNAFMPESKAGGQNRFGLMNKQIVKLNYFKIYDRWGKLVFETTDPTKEWDGTINGEPAPYAVYVWEADGFCISGNRLVKTGNVTLLR